MRVLFPVLLAVVACGAAGCSPGPAEPGDAGKPDCAVTMPERPDSMPSILRQSTREAPWHGRDGLWVHAWWLDDSRTQRAEDANHVVKYPTVTTEDGRLTEADGPPTVRARRLDGSGSVRAETGGYARAAQTTPSEWWPTVFRSLAAGCWEVTTSWRDATVRYVAEVA
ncbi:hypothetical protein [Amycolatopsis aidingensis]|uniref:hypothetical protein n=1 Tax=Amycolatopsis aidingensis TaxID=2842453 RepID=UPI001C0CE4A6|nr:hypothetical protein [Amycolatopsis aidingensis]